MKDRRWTILILNSETGKVDWQVLAIVSALVLPILRYGALRRILFLV